MKKTTGQHKLKGIPLKGTKESTMEWILKFLMHQDPRDLGLICFSSQKRNVRSVFDSFRFKNPILDFLKEMHPKYQTFRSRGVSF